MKWFSTLAIVFVSWFFTSWMFMLLVGVVRAEWLTSLPTIGYGNSLTIGALISVTIGFRAMFGTFVKEILDGKS